MQSKHLLRGTLAAVAVYWVAGWVIPDPYLSSTASFALLAFGIAVFARYVPAAWDVLFNNRRLYTDGRKGSHLAVLGVTMLAAGAIYIGVFGLLWVLADQPDHWLGTSASGFGRALAAGGFWLMYASPDVVNRDMRIPSLAWLFLVIAASTLSGIYLGAQLDVH